MQVIRGQFDAQLSQILANLSTVQRSKYLKTKDFVTDLLDWDGSDEAFKAAISPYIYSVIVETGKDAMEAIGMEPSLYDPFTPAISNYQDERTTKIAQDVNDETEKQLRASITEGINAGETTYEIRARIEAVMGAASTLRADLIASTEVARAQSYADVEAWLQSGVVTGKEWYTAEDEKVCAWCNDMDGKIIGLEENYFNKGETQTVTGTNRNGEPKTLAYKHDYDNVSGAPLHPRCRCTLLPVRVR